MKSIVQEASTLLKAIDQAWQQAGCPQEFSVKVLQEAEKNFIGMTTKSAKIALFFQAKPVRKERPKRARELVQQKRSTRPSKNIIQSDSQSPQERRPTPVQQKNVADKVPQDKIIWSEDMIKIAQKWMDDALAILDLKSVDYSTNSSNYYLRMNFSQPLTDSKEVDQQMLRSFSILMLQSLRHKFKRPLRGFKIVLISP